MPAEKRVLTSVFSSQHLISPKLLGTSANCLTTTSILVSWASCALRHTAGPASTTHVIQPPIWLSGSHHLIAISNDGAVLTSPMSSPNKWQTHSERSSEKDTLPCLWFLLCLDQAGAGVMTNSDGSRVESLQLLLRGLLFEPLGFLLTHFLPSVCSSMLEVFGKNWTQSRMPSTFPSLLSVSVFLPVCWNYCLGEFYPNLIFLNNFIKF